MENTRPATVTIVGRPNVGKSSLFNRIVKKRTAIVDPTSGVTRDVISQNVVWEHKAFVLADTAGITFDKVQGEELERSVQEQTIKAIEISDFLILLLDVKDGLTPLDMMVYKLLVKSDKPFCVVVNKVDNEELKLELSDFYRLSASKVFPISALHAKGLYEVLDNICENIAFCAPEEEKKENLKIAIVGKPNVGKSSFLNRITRKAHSLVSNIPGTTRDSIDADYEYKSRKITLIDTAGMRKSKILADAIEKYSMIRTKDSIERCDIALVIMDAEQGVRQQDRRILRMVTEQNKGCVIAVNKWDLVTDKTIRQFEQEVYDTMGAFHYIPVIFISAHSGLNVKKCLDLVLEVDEFYNTSLATPRLNRFIKELTELQPAPVMRGKRLKIYYAVQPFTKPPTIELFINSKKCVSQSYLRYLLNELRQEYGFTGVPLKIVFREKPPKAKQDAAPEVASKALSKARERKARKNPAGTKRKANKQAKMKKSKTAAPSRKKTNTKNTKKTPRKK